MEGQRTRTSHSMFFFYPGPLLTTRRLNALIRRHASLTASELAQFYFSHFDSETTPPVVSVTNGSSLGSNGATVAIK